MSNKNDSLGDRMKGYEDISRICLTKRMPVIIRIDGKAFHSFTKGFQRPFDDALIKTMQGTAKYLCENIMGCKLAYTQSDEISLLLIDYERIETQPWFENNLQKIVSIASSMATLAFNKLFVEALPPMGTLSAEQANHYWNAINKGAMFDARAFILPKEEVCNYFIWRQQDATRNSIQMAAQALFSHNQLQNKNCNQLQEMMFQEHNINWNDYATVYKRGSCCIRKEHRIQNEVLKDAYETIVTHRWEVDDNIPIFTQDRNYIDKLVFVDV